MDSKHSHTDDLAHNTDEDTLMWLNRALAKPAFMAKLSELAVERNHELGVPVHLADDVGIYLICPDGSKKYVEYFDL